MFEQYTTSLALPAIKIVFYIILALLSISSAITLYSLIRYGKDRMLVVSVSITFIVIMITLYFIAVSQLNRIQF